MSQRFPVVGIGASAGGVEALQAFFRAMPDPPPAMAFVVVTHLGANQDSALQEILQKCTTMPVLPMHDGDHLQPGHAYVPQHDAIIKVAEGRLVLRHQAEAAGRERQLIDLLFTSLASDVGPDAIGVVLSGNGSDGTLGLKAIKDAGGLTLAQVATGSEPFYAGMPESAVAAHVVDLVLPVESMPDRLANLLLHPVQLDMSSGDQRDDLAKVQQTISGILRSATGHDFSGYKDKTFFRRVQRRMQATQAPDLSSYVATLQDDFDEANRLFHDLLISVTSFFRDAEAFAALEKIVMPALFEGRGKEDVVRIWVAGCATGEEAYSLAMLAQEQMAKQSVQPSVQIFATDIDDAALEVARLGRYPKSMMAGVSAERLARFFNLQGEFYTIRPETRELCVFSTHNVVRDPPFSRIDLVSCRNMLIYMGGHLQEQVIPLLHYALRPSGFLFLGIAETVARYSELFSAADKAHRIFRKRDLVGASLPPRLPQPAQTSRRQWLASGPPRQPDTSSAAELQQLACASTAELFGPPHLLVNAEGNIMYQSAGVTRYIELPRGIPSRQIFSIVRRGLRPELRAALREAAETRRRVIRPLVKVEHEGKILLVDITVAPVSQRDSLDSIYLVAFVEHSNAPEHDAPHVSVGDVAPHEELVGQLEAELHDTRERLQSMSEEYEAAAEELKSANEEMVSANEELQSTNEELETSREEIQSVNEELRARNLELSSKLEELDRANADLRNLFDSTQVATIFLDRNFLIRSFTPAVTVLFDLVPGDRGRPLTSFATNLDAVDIRSEAWRAMNERTPIEQRVTAGAGTSHYLLRILPYTTASAEIDGVVLTFFDITKVVEGEHLGSLVDELNHRVRNMLQVVSAVAKHTLRRATSLEEFSTTFSGRIQALARAHELVSVGGWRAVSLTTLMTKELDPYSSDTNQVTMVGPPIHLKPKAALTLGMVLHELATNAAKYGALSTETGRVQVAWFLADRESEQSLILRWSETGGPKPERAPARKGFGSELIERSVRHDLGGMVDVTLGDDGLVAELALPLTVIARSYP